jgi:hypothetical protein
VTIPWRILPNIGKPGMKRGTQQVRTLHGILKHSPKTRQCTAALVVSLRIRSSAIGGLRLVLHMRSIKRLEGDSVAKH